MLFQQCNIAHRTLPRDTGCVQTRRSCSSQQPSLLSQLIEHPSFPTYHHLPLVNMYDTFVDLLRMTKVKSES